MTDSWDGSRPPVVLESPADIAEWTRNRNSNGEINFNIDGATTRNRFREFFSKYKQNNIFIYRERLCRQWNNKEFLIDVDLAHLEEYDEVLYKKILVLAKNYLTPA